MSLSKKISKTEKGIEFLEKQLRQARKLKDNASQIQTIKDALYVENGRLKKLKKIKKQNKWHV